MQQQAPSSSPWARDPGLFGPDKAHHLDLRLDSPNRSSGDFYQQPGHLHGDKAHNHDDQLGAQQDLNRRYRYPIKAPTVRRTSVWAWLAAILCAILWTAIFIGGLAVLIVYLLFRPKSPRFDISSVALNGAYLDTGTLLNADLTILANFTNPNRKIDVTFRYVAVDLYFKGTLIATQGVDGFAERAGESTLRSLHMVTSQVELSREQAAEWGKEVGAPDGVKMEVRGSFLTTSDFVGTFLRLSYSLHGLCDIAVTGPPSGVLLSSNCTTRSKR